jgi:hypothetical protein
VITFGDLRDHVRAIFAIAMERYAHGGWPVLGDLRVGSFDALILEDTLADDDGTHTNEQLAYLLLSAPLADAPTIDRFEAIPVDPFEGTAIRLEWETTGASSVEIQPDVGAPLPADGEASVTPVGETLYTLTATGPGGQVVTTVTVSPVARPPVPLSSFELAIDNAAWLPVALPAGTFTTPVVIATPAYGQGGAPAIARIRNVGADGFEIIAARADGGAEPLPAVTMQVLVVEAGRYTEAVHGVNLEAGTVGDLAAVGKPNIAGTPLAGLQNAYGTPVVLGHVQSTNDARFQTFFATGGSSTSPPSAGDIRIGRHTGEDPDGDRAAETVGYVVVEAGTWTVNGSTLVAGRTADQVRGVDDTAPYSQAIEGLASVDGAALSLNGVDGGDGGWPLFSGPDPVTAAALAVSIDEDTLGDGDRTHTTEQVGWVVFGN